MMRYQIILLAALFVSTNGLAQQLYLDADDRAAIGIAAGGAYDSHTADFHELPAVANCCPQFVGGSGAGWSIAAFGELPLTHSLAFDLRAGFTSAGATLATDEQTMLTVNDVLTPGTFRHSIDATIGIAGVEPLAVMRLFDSPLRAQVGARIGYVLTKTFSQREEITQPASTGVFTDNGLRVRNTQSGTIPEAQSLAASLVAGIRVEFPLSPNHTLWIAPEVMGDYALTPIVHGLDWHANAIAAGVSLIYRPAPTSAEEQPRVQNPLRTDPSVNDEKIVSPTLPRTSPPAPTLTVVGINADGTPTPEMNIRVEENIGTRMRPLLPYVFFDNQSAEIPSRYVRLTPGTVNTFHPHALHNLQTLDIYHHILNIIGQRMRQNSRATLTLMGCTSDRGLETNARELARRRADAVREYLISVWGINGERVFVDARDLPGTPTRPDTNYGMEENRRVEIASDTWEILAPVVTHDTLRTATPPVIRFKPAAHTEVGTSQWTLSAMQPGVTLRTFRDSKEPAAWFDWNINAEKETIPRAPSPVTAAFEVIDKSGQRGTASAATLPVDQITIQRKLTERIADSTIDEFSLILFDFNSAEIGAANKRICNMIRDSIRAGSAVLIVGYSDFSGDPALNQRLAQQRAEAAAREINTQNSMAIGRGYDPMLFENTSPEGRFYCRTVTVRVKTPTTG